MDICCACDNKATSIQNDYRQMEPFYLDFERRHDFNVLCAMVLLVKARGALVAADHL